MTASAVQPVIWHPDGRRVLRCAADWPLLRVAPGQDMGEAVHAQWKLGAWVLHDGGLAVGHSGQPHLQLLEDAALQDGGAEGLHWQEHSVPPLPHARPWQQPGWPAQALERLDGALAAHHLTRQGGLSAQANNDLACVLRAETPAGSVFLKVGDSPREAAVTALLARTLPTLLPPVLWADPASSSLLTLSGGTLMDGVQDAEVWLEAARQLARFQTGADADALAALGCPAFPLLEMADRVDAFLADAETLMEWGIEAEPLAELTQARPVTRAAFRELAALNLPERPAHGDAHPRNALSGDAGPVWFDWAEAASAAHPFMHVGWLLAFTFHPARSSSPVRKARAGLERELMAAYLAQLGCPEAAPLLSRAVPLALLHRAVVYDARFRHWAGTVPGWRPNFVPYYLRLARRELARLWP